MNKILPGLVFLCVIGLTRTLAGQAIRGLGMRFNAGHALNYFNVDPVARLPRLDIRIIRNWEICRHR